MTEAETAGYCDGSDVHPTYYHRYNDNGELVAATEGGNLVCLV